VAKRKYEEWITRNPLKKSKQAEITAPMIAYKGDSGGKDLTFDWSCVSKPLVMYKERQTNDFDQVIAFTGSNLNDYEDFQAEIELSLGKEGKKYTITGPQVVYIPMGLTFGQLNFKRVDKPISYMNFYLSPKFSEKGTESDYSKYMAKPRITRNTIEFKTFVEGKLFRERKIPNYEMNCQGQDFGGCNLSIFWYTVTHAHVMEEPTHSHHFDMWVVFLGGDYMNVGDLGAEMEMWWGKEAEKLTIDSTSVVHIPAELIHRSIDYRRISKPFTHINLFTSPKYYKDQVFSEEGDITDIKMAEGSN
jgi:hypothetical protein